MWLILQQSKPDDFVISTGEQHSVREFVEKSFRYAGIEIQYAARCEPVQRRSHSCIVTTEFTVA